MRIFEVKNNLVKVFYEANDNLFLSGFVMIKDSREAYIGQIMHLESSKHGNIAIAKLIFNVKSDGVIAAYSGSIPAINSAIVSVDSVDFLKLIQGKTPIIIGELAERDVLISLDKSLLENKLVICSESQEYSDLIVKTLNQQIKNYGKKTIIIDTDGESVFDKNTFIAATNFKLPINHQLINFIYEKGIEYKSARSKAILQETFLEIQYYLSTIEDKYVPVNKFIDILETQYQKSNIPELVLLKNALIKFDEAGIFARNVNDYKQIEHSLNENQVTVINISGVDDIIQREFISYIYFLVQQILEDYYVFVKVNNGNSDKKLLKQIFSVKNVYTTTICSYSYKYLTELKKISKDLILFSPIIQQQDFASYNTFMNKLGRMEFIVYGKATQYMPLISKISEKAILVRAEVNSSMTPEHAKEIVEEQLRLQQTRNEEEKIKIKEYEIHKKKQQQSVQQQMQQMVQQPVMPQQPQICYPQQMIYPQMFAPQPFMQPIPQPFIMQSPYIQMPMQQAYAQQYVTPPGYPEQQVPPQPQQMPNVSQEQFTTKPEQETEQEKIEVPVFQSIEPQQMPVETEIEEQMSTAKPSINTQLTEDDLDLIENNDLYSDYEATEQESETYNSKEYVEEEDDSYLDDIKEEDTIVSQYEIKEEEELKQETEIIAEYKANTQNLVQSDENLEKGDLVVHEKFGNGRVEKTIKYGSKKLCSVYFDGVGRRLLDPTISELKKITA